METPPFPVKLGRRLREIRRDAGLTQPEVAERMGLTRREQSLVCRLEQGRVANPTLQTIGRFLRACGARWQVLNTVLDDLSIPAVKLAEAPLELAPEGRRRRVREQTERQVVKYALALPDRYHQRPVAPERQAVARKRFADYRVVANLVGEGVLGVLRETELPLMAYPFYRAVGRHLLGLLWRMARTSAGREELLNHKSGLPDRIREKLEAKDLDWRRQRLDPEIVAQVQATVLAWCRELLRRNPELFPEPKPSR